MGERASGATRTGATRTATRTGSPAGPEARRTPPRAAQRALRRWLRVPEQLALPAWATERLIGAVRDQVRGRVGEPLDRVVFGIVDLETTGTSAERDRILEIGLVVQRAGRVLDRYATLVDTGVEIPPVIRALTGIAEADVIGAPSQSTALAGLRDALERHRVGALVAHNAPFDRRFLELAWREEFGAVTLPPFLCSLRLSRRLIRAPRYGLDVLAHQLAIPFTQRHRALADAEITAELWSELLQRARIHDMHTLSRLRSAAEPRRPRRRAPRPRRVVDVLPSMG